MINSLSGILTKKTNDSINLELNGIEFSIVMPFNSIARLSSLGERVKIFTYLQHSQDAMQLFGFSEEKERILFMDLIKVSGIGPKQAIKILSGIDVETFVKQLDDNDVTALSRLPGIGKKTAQKIILALRGKLSLESEDSTSSGSNYNDVIHALIEMGFDKKSVENAVNSISIEKEVLDASPTEREQIVFKRSIILLSS